MKIANPIYDAAFKYLLEDTEIAKGLISMIIEEEIVELAIKPQEIQIKSEKYLIVILRIDFKAIIKTKEGIFKKVLIEIQKGKKDKDILRFRRYLSDNYRIQDEVKLNNGQIEKKDLPIIPIYFLGFKLKMIKSPVVKAERIYKDLITNKDLTEKEQFIESLTHDGYFIQIPRLHQKQRNELERILNVFNQSYKSSDNRLIEIPDSELGKNPLLQKIGARLLKAASDEEVLAKMNLEDEIEQRIEQHIRENEELKENNKLLLNILEEKDKVLEEKDKVLEEKEYTAIKQFMELTNLSDAEIATMRNVSLLFVQKIRKDLKEL